MFKRKPYGLYMCCSDKSSFSRNSTDVMVSSALIESNNVRIRSKTFFNMSATFSSRSVSDKGSSIIVLGIGGNGKLNLQTA